MESLNGREIDYLKLHGGDAFSPTVGGLGTTLPPKSKTLVLYMEHTESGVYVNINSGKAEIIIPWANVQLAQYKGGAPKKKIFDNAA